MKEISDIIKKYKTYICWGAAIGFIGIPFLAYILSEAKVLPVCGNNDWAGFWGSYFGTIIGGGITLSVMYATVKDNQKNLDKTLKFEKEKVRREEKRIFNNELLEQVAKYQTYLLDIYRSITSRDIRSDFYERLKESTILSKIIVIKLDAIQKDAEYLYAKELEESVVQTTESFNKLVDMLNKEIKGETIHQIPEQEKETKEKINNLMNDIEEYFKKNGN